MKPLNSTDQPIGCQPQNLTALSILAVIVIAQVLLLLSAWGLFPSPTANPYDVLPEWMKEFHPEQETFLYRLFVFGAAGLYLLGCWIFSKKLVTKELRDALVRWIILEGVLAAYLAFEIFRIKFFNSPADVGVKIFLLTILTLAGKVFWWPIYGSAPFSRPVRLNYSEGLVHEEGQRLSVSWLVRRFSDGLVAAAVFLVLYIPDLSAAVSYFFVHDRFYHMDGFVMASGWAFVNQMTPNIDIFSQYGCGLPALVGLATKILGGFSYENVLAVFVLMGIVYFLLCYVLLRLWLKDFLCALLGLILLLKFLMFPSVEVPVLWQVPQSTVVRYFFDVVFFLLLFGHAQTAQSRYLWLAGLLVGLSIFYINDTGVYQLLVLYAYLLLLFVIPVWRESGRSGMVRYLKLFIQGALPLAVALLLSGIFIGPKILSQTFWKNQIEHVPLALSGYGAVPMMEGFKNGHVFPYFLGLFVPVFYVLVGLTVLGLCYLKTVSREHIFVVVLALSGLCLYHHYAGRSDYFHLYAVTTPFFLIVAYLLKILFNRVESKTRRVLQGAFLGCLVVSVFFTKPFSDYPNVFRNMKSVFTEEGRFYQENSPAVEDVQLIRGLTLPADRVCLISSFEVAILISADRKPFFYYTPMINSKNFKMRDFWGTLIPTKERRDKNLGQLIEEKPTYVFIEKNLFAYGIPKIYYQRFPMLSVLVQYLHAYYEPAQEGRWLVALQRK